MPVYTRPQVIRSSCVPHIAIAQIAAARAVPRVIRFDFGEAVGHGEPGMPVEIVEPRRILSENRVLDRPVGWAQRLEGVALLHFLRDFEAAQSLDLPLR